MEDTCYQSLRSSSCGASGFHRLKMVFPFLSLNVQSLHHPLWDHNFALHRFHSTQCAKFSRTAAAVWLELPWIKKTSNYDMYMNMALKLSSILLSMHLFILWVSHRSFAHFIVLVIGLWNFLLAFSLPNQSSCTGPHSHSVPSSQSLRLLLPYHTLTYQTVKSNVP